MTLPTESQEEQDKELEQSLFKLISDISVETESYIEAKGQLIRLPMKARIKPIMAMIKARDTAIEQRARESFWLDVHSYTFKQPDQKWGRHRQSGFMEGLEYVRAMGRKKLNELSQPNAQTTDK